MACALLSRPLVAAAPAMCKRCSVRCHARVRVESLVDARIVYCCAPAQGHNQEGHPECSARVPAILEELEKAELTAERRGKEIVEIIDFMPASKEHVQAVHSKSYIQALEEAMPRAESQGVIFIEGTGPTYATSMTYNESMIAAGGSLALVDSVVAASRKSNEPPIGFALVRPPGHHAVPTGPMGFCVLGNVAIAARHVQHAHHLKRVFIIDFDVHHGNGTQNAFYDDPDVFFLSTHQDGSYPGTGKMKQVGKGRGEGTTLNLPLPGGSGHRAMSNAFEEVIVPTCQRFKPDIILVSAGYDAHVLDPLASLQFTTTTYYDLACGIKQLARELCGGRCIFFLEGGYNLEALSHSVADSFRGFLGENSCAEDPAFLYEEPYGALKHAITEVKAIHGL